MSAEIDELLKDLIPKLKQTGGEELVNEVRLLFHRKETEQARTMAMQKCLSITKEVIEALGNCPHVQLGLAHALGVTYEMVLSELPEETREPVRKKCIEVAQETERQVKEMAEKMGGMFGDIGAALRRHATKSKE